MAPPAKETLVSLTTAGISTVATALEWLLLLLARDPVAQDRARADARRGSEMRCPGPGLEKTVLRHTAPQSGVMFMFVFHFSFVLASTFVFMFMPISTFVLVSISRSVFIFTFEL